MCRKLDHEGIKLFFFSSGPLGEENGNFDRGSKSALVESISVVAVHLM